MRSLGSLALLILFTFSAQAQTLSDALLSKEQSQVLKLDEQKLEAERKKLRDSWISPIEGSYSGTFKDQYGRQQESYTGSVSISQPIFKSGGIYYAIKYAQANAYYNKLGLKLSQQALIKEVVAAIINLRILDYKISQTQNTLGYYQTLVDYNKELLQAGEVDLATLNSAMITRNETQSTLETLRIEKTEQLYIFQKLSDAAYESVALPELSLVDQKAFVADNLELMQIKEDVKQKDYAQGVVFSNYMPELSLNAAYNASETVNQAFSNSLLVGDTSSEYVSYGFKFSMPLYDINRGRSIESAKVDTLKAQTELALKTKDVALFYEKTLKKVQSYERQMALAQENLTLYNEVLKSVASLVESGDKDRVVLIQSRQSYENKKLDLNILELQKKLELLNLYEKLNEKAPL